MNDLEPANSTPPSPPSELIPVSEPMPAREPSGPAATHSFPEPPSLSRAASLGPSFVSVDRAAGIITWGLLLLGLLSGARVLVRLSEQPGAGVGPWIDGFFNAAYRIGIHGLAGLGLGAALSFLGRWAALRAQHGEERQRGLETLAERIENLVAGLAASQPAGGASAAPASALDLLKEQSLAEIRRSIRAGRWEKAGALFDAFSRDYLNDPHVLALHQELESAREAARREHLAQLEAARQVNDPERVLELHQILIPLLEAEARAALEADLSKWFLNLMHRRLRTGKIQTEVVVLAGRIADVFSHTVQGASLRAALPTLRRSAGLCPRCAQPYTGLADACPSCLDWPLPPVPAPSPPPPSP